MGRPPSERRFQLMENYPVLRAEGLGPADIAKQFGYSPSFVRNILGEIAELHGVTRESLLLFPHTISEEGKAALIAAAKKPRKRTATEESGIFDPAEEPNANLAQPLRAEKPDEPEVEHEEFDVETRLNDFIATKERIQRTTQRALQSVHDRIRDIKIWEERLQ